MAALIKHTLANTFQYLGIDYRLNRGSCLATAFLCTVSSVALTRVFKHQGLIAAGCMTLAAFARRISYVAKDNRSVIPPFLVQKLPLSRSPTLREIVLHDPVKLNSFLSGLQNTMRLNDELERVQTEWNLTALHVSVLTQNWCAVELLVNRGASLITQDKMGSTPLHLAVLVGNQELLEKLEALAVKRGVDYQKIKDRNGATVAQLKLISNPPNVSPNTVVTHLRKETGQTVPITAEQYKALTGTEFCNYVYMPPKQLLEKWIADVDVPISDDPQEKDAVAQFLSSRPNGILVQNGKTGMGVLAARDLEPGEITFRYGGEVVDPADPRASQYSNNVSQINDGFPRLYLENIGGLGSSEEMGLVVCYKTLADTELTIDYGSEHGCKYDRYVIVDEAILKTFHWDTALTELKQFCESETHAESYQDRLRENLFVAPISYLINTPRAMAYLLFSNVFSLAQLKELHQLVNKDSEVGNEYHQLLKEYREKLIKIYTTLETLKDPKFTLAINGFIKNVFEKHRVIVGMYQIRHLADALEEDYPLYDRDPGAWSVKMDERFTLLQLLDQFLDFCDPKIKVSLEAFEEITIKLKQRNFSNALLTNMVLFPFGTSPWKKARTYLTDKHPERPLQGAT